MTMKKAIVLRGESSTEGTFGKITTEGLTLFTMERPWLNNQNGISCIPTGIYTCEYIFWPKFKKFSYQLTGTGKRLGIKIHSANLVSQLEGCIALGEQLGKIDGKKALLLSRPAITKFESAMNREKFQLEVK